MTLTSTIRDLVEGHETAVLTTLFLFFATVVEVTGGVLGSITLWFAGGYSTTPSDVNLRLIAKYGAYAGSASTVILFGLFLLTSGLFRAIDSRLGKAIMARIFRIQMKDDIGDYGLPTSHVASEKTSLLEKNPTDAAVRRIEALEEQITNVSRALVCVLGVCGAYVRLCLMTIAVPAGARLASGSDSTAFYTASALSSLPFFLDTIMWVVFYCTIVEIDSVTDWWGDSWISKFLWWVVDQMEALPEYMDVILFVAYYTALFSALGAITFSAFGAALQYSGVTLAPISAMAAAGAVFGASVLILLAPFIVGLYVFTDDDEDDDADDDDDDEDNKEYSA